MADTALAWPGQAVEDSWPGQAAEQQWPGAPESAPSSLVDKVVSGLPQMAGAAALGFVTGGTSAPGVTTGFIDKPIASPEQVRAVMPYAQPFAPLTEAVDAAKTLFPDAGPTKVASGALSGIADTLSSATAPGNIALLGTAGLGRAAELLIAGAFAGQAATHLPAEWKQFNETQDPEQKTRLAVGMVASLGLPLSALVHGMKGEVRSTKEEPAAAAAQATTADAWPGAPVESVPPIDIRNSTFDIPVSKSEPPAVTIEMGGIPIEQLIPSEPRTLNPEPSLVPFRADESIPFMSKVRIEDQLKTAGLDDATIAALTTDQVQEILAQSRLTAPASIPETLAPITDIPAPSAPAIEPVAPEQAVAPVLPIVSQPEANTAPLGVTLKSFADLPSAAELAAETEHRASLLREAQTAQAGQGAELLDAVVRAGGLPSRENPHRQAFAGEIARLDEAARDPQRAEKLPLNKIFRKDAPGIDTLATSLRDQGFDVQTPGDLLSLMEHRLTTGKPLYGQPEQARLFASGSAAPKARSDQGQVFAAGAAAPVPPAAIPQSIRQLPDTPHSPAPHLPLP